MASLSVTILQVLAQTLQIYSLVLIVRVLLSWFPNLDWGNPVLSTVSSITDPYLNAFRGLIPPLGGIDLSAILAFVALNLLQQLLLNASFYFYAGGLSYCISCSRGRRSSPSLARLRTGAENPLALAFRISKGPGVPAGTAIRRANGWVPGVTSPIDPTRVLLGRTGSPLASRIRA